MIRSLNRGNKRTVTRSLVEKLLKAGTRGSLLRSYNITQTHRRQSWKGRKCKQMRLCDDFNAGPSKEQALFFLFWFNFHSLLLPLHYFIYFFLWVPSYFSFLLLASVILIYIYIVNYVFLINSPFMLFMHALAGGRLSSRNQCFRPRFLHYARLVTRLVPSFPAFLPFSSFILPFLPVFLPFFLVPLLELFFSPFLSFILLPIVFLFYI